MASSNVNPSSEYISSTSSVMLSVSAVEEVDAAVLDAGREAVLEPLQADKLKEIGSAKTAGESCKKVRLFMILYLTIKKEYCII